MNDCDINRFLLLEQFPVLNFNRNKWIKLTNNSFIKGINFCFLKFQVGAAISMTYITGQPIVFVGTGQTYTDLKSLNAKAVVHALMK